MSEGSFSPSDAAEIKDTQEKERTHYQKCKRK